MIQINDFSLSPLIPEELKLLAARGLATYHYIAPGTSGYGCYGTLSDDVVPFVVSKISSEFIEIAIAEMEFDKILGIREIPAFNTAEVEYSEKIVKITPVGEIYSDLNIGKSYTASATFIKYNDGWRLGEMQTNSKQFTITDIERHDFNLVKIDGIAYKTITIGQQTWMAQNLKTTRLNDGTELSNITSNEQWGTILSPAFCWYNNDENTYKDTYGALYNWYAVNTGKLCPSGWHVPTQAEWKKLTIYLGGEQNAGRKLREIGTTHWMKPNNGATNVSGFTALPGGGRTNTGNYDAVGGSAIWWSSDEYSSTDAWEQVTDWVNTHLMPNTLNKKFGLSVRCLKDN